MKLLWVLLAVAAVAAPLAFAEEKPEQLSRSDWREKAIERLKAAIARLEESIAKLPEDSKLLPGLKKALEYLQKRLAGLEGKSFSLGDEVVDREGFLKRVLERLEQALEKLPEGPIRERLQKAIDRIRELLKSKGSDDAFAVNDKVRDLLQKIRRLIDENKAKGKEALLEFLKSEALEALVSQLPERVQADVRKRIEALKTRLEGGSSLSLSDWREKAIERLKAAIARLEESIAKLPEDSKLLPGLKKALEYLQKRLAGLEGKAFSDEVFDREGFLKRVLERLEQALEKLPEGPIRERLQKAIDRIRELLKPKGSDDAFAAIDKVRDLLQKIRRLIDENKAKGKEALLEFLKSEALEALVSQLPERVQADVRKRIEALKTRLEGGSSLSLSDSRDKAIERLKAAIASLEEKIAKLPEDSKLLPGLKKALEYLQKRLAGLEGKSFSLGDEVANGRLKWEDLQKIIDRLRELLNKNSE